MTCELISCKDGRQNRMFLTCQIPLGLATTFPSTAPVLTPFFIVGKNSRQIVAAPDRTISYGKTRLRLARAIPKGIRSVYFERDTRAGHREAMAGARRRAHGRSQLRETVLERVVANWKRLLAGIPPGACLPGRRCQGLPLCSGATGPFFIAARNAGNSPRRLR